MANISNIRIIVDNDELEYESPRDLGIKLNRIVDELNSLDTRFGEFSYTFSLPKTKNNRKILGFPDVKGRRGIFVNTQKECKVFNNNELLIDGILELRSVRDEVYDCALFSKFTQLVDSIEGKTLQDIQSLGIIPAFNYEQFIVDHLNQNYKDCDETSYQFPFVWYNTPFTPSSMLNTADNDFRGNAFIPNDKIQNWYYLFSSDSASQTPFNEFFHPQFPPAIYIVKILEAILQDAGWTLDGSFFKRSEVKKIVMLYSGDNDVYDRATEQVSGSTAVNVDLAKFMPDMDQTEFISGLINTFNLYFTIDTVQKIIKFETWTTLFNDKFDPYDITNKVFGDTVKLSRIDNFDPSILFQDVDNKRVLGDGKVMTDSGIIAKDIEYGNIDNKITDLVFNRIGTTDEIELPFGMPVVKRTYLRNDYDIQGANRNTLDMNVFLPMLTEATPQDNVDFPFYDDIADTFLNNTEDKIKHEGTPTLMYYYGQSTSDLVINTTQAKDLYWLGIGTTPTRTRFGFASPFTIPQEDAVDRLNTHLNNVNLDPSLIATKDTAEVSYLKGNFFNLGLTGGTLSDIPEYSLTFGDSETFNETLWTKFHRPKYDLYFNSELLEANMRMNVVDWKEMQINRPIQYNNEIYGIISIQNYDPIANTAEVKLIKK